MDHASIADIDSVVGVAAPWREEMCTDREVVEAMHDVPVNPCRKAAYGVAGRPALYVDRGSCGGSTSGNLFPVTMYGIFGCG
jgi:hypothetical protein